MTIHQKINSRSWFVNFNDRFRLSRRILRNFNYPACNALYPPLRKKNRNHKFFR